MDNYRFIKYYNEKSSSGGSNSNSIKKCVPFDNYTLLLCSHVHPRTRSNNLH